MKATQAICRALWCIISNDDDVMWPGIIKFVTPICFGSIISTMAGDADLVAIRLLYSAPTAWDFSQDLGNLGVNLGFGDFAMQSWDFLVL